jgi:hypothetical protein
MVGGAAIAGVLLHANYLDPTEKDVSSASSLVGVGIDGSVFKNVPLFRRVPRPLVSTCLSVSSHAGDDLGVSRLEFTS